MNNNNFKEFTINKKGIEFIFRNPELNKYDNLVFEYKILKHKEKENNEGFYYNAEFNQSKKAITFPSVKINNKPCNGMLLDYKFEEVNNLYISLTNARKELFDKTVEDVANGIIPITFSIVGCDYPHYQGWVREIDKDLEGQEQDIMLKAIKIVNKDTEFVGNSCDYLERKFKQRISTIDNMHISTFNHKFNKETQKYHDYKETIITSFQIKLSDIINTKEIEAKIQKQNEIEEYRKSFKVEILKQNTTTEDFYAEVIISDVFTNESLKFVCRNIFDFGYTINPLYEIVKGKKGGLEHKGMWQDYDVKNGWYDVRELTKFEKRCLKYLNDFPPISKEFRL